MCFYFILFFYDTLNENQCLPCAGDSLASLESESNIKAGTGKV